MVREETLLRLVAKINELIKITQEQSVQIKHLNTEINRIKCNNATEHQLFVSLTDLENLPSSDSPTVEVPGLYSFNKFQSRK